MIQEKNSYYLAIGSAVVQQEFERKLFFLQKMAYCALILSLIF